MATTGGNWTAGNPPRNIAHTPAPKPLNAVAARASVVDGNLTTNRVVGRPLPEDVAISIDGQNLLDIITDLQTRLTTLEGV